MPATTSTCPRRLFGPPTTDVRFCRSGEADKGEPKATPATRNAPETYSRLAQADAQQRYDEIIGDFPA